MTAGPRVAVALAVPGIVASVLAAAAPGARALTWTRATALPATDVYSVERHGTTLYAGTEDVVWVSANGGATWAATSPVVAGAAGIETVLPAGGALWVGTFAQGVHRSTDGGATWTPVNAGLAGLGALNIVRLIERAGKLYAATGGSGVFVLDLAAPAGWSAFDAGFPVATAGSVGALAVHGTTLLAPAGGNGFVYRHPLGAPAWQEVNVSPPIAPGLVPSDLVSSAGVLVLGSTARLHRSTDAGLTWQFVGGDVISGVEVFLATTGSTFFAGMNRLGNVHRIYRSGDAGVTWEDLGEVAAALYGFATSGDRLWAARWDGLWWAQLETSDREDPVPVPRVVLAQNVPNPFNPTTTIAFELPAAVEVTLRVFDARGRRVATLLDGVYLRAGPHRVEFGDPALPSGVYVYELRAGPTAATRKMILVR